MVDCTRGEGWRAAFVPVPQIVQLSIVYRINISSPHDNC